MSELSWERCWKQSAQFTFYTPLFLDFTSALQSCLATLSVLTDKHHLISFHIETSPRASKQMSDLPQLWVCPPQTKDIVSVSKTTESDEMFKLIRSCVEHTWWAGAGNWGYNDFTSETDRQGQLCSHCERKTHKIQTEYRHTHTDTQTYTHL